MIFITPQHEKEGHIKTNCKRTGRIHFYRFEILEKQPGNRRRNEAKGAGFCQILPLQTQQYRTQLEEQENKSHRDHHSGNRASFLFDGHQRNRTHSQRKWL